MTDKLTVSVLGTGIMGAAMARNLARAGHGVRAWNRSRAKAEPLAADGAQIADSPEEAVRGADVVLTMLYDGPAALDVMRGPHPGCAGARVGAVDDRRHRGVGELAASPARTTRLLRRARPRDPRSPPRPVS